MKSLIRFGDYAGMTASALCLLHCLAMPLLMAAFPMLGLAHEHDAFHDSILAAVSIPVLLSLLPGYLRHRDLAVLVLGALGLASFLAAVFILSPVYGELAEAAGAVLSGVLLLSAHIRNRRFCARCSSAGAGSTAPCA
ncbi:MerC domain-containing protein [Massilia sp. ST3]|uniref:MerC domain-containing protein n=1 Tax=Massilia sp. ST3 TaxID=2824903 RepID=UPI001B828F21|nr:MerC domain-containing protein [Massilia sp. ST3]MBQ5948922.1 MerC domain-containing protein [Massilia sp. ST3]